MKKLKYAINVIIIKVIYVLNNVLRVQMKYLIRAGAKRKLNLIQIKYLE